MFGLLFVDNRCDTDILHFLVTKIFGVVKPVRRHEHGHQEVHLTEDKSDLGFAFEVDGTVFDHLVVKIVTFTIT
jgi:hypothetical protein